MHDRDRFISGRDVKHIAERQHRSAWICIDGIIQVDEFETFVVAGFQFQHRQIKVSIRANNLHIEPPSVIDNCRQIAGIDEVIPDRDKVAVLGDQDS